MESDVPVNALVVGNAPPPGYVRCSVHKQLVPERLAVFMHGGRGYEPSATCFNCLRVSTDAWLAENCEFCTRSAERILTALDEYERTGEPFTLPDVPDEELPPHRPGCRWESSVLR